MTCQKCDAGDHPFKCFVCEHDGSLEFYKTEATPEQVFCLLALAKVCTEHAKEIDEALMRREKTLAEAMAA